MIAISRKISGREFVIFCGETLKSQADWLLCLLERIENERGSGFLQDGTKIQVGWSMITIRREGGTMVVVEPNFAGNPFLETNRDLTCTLTVQVEQNFVLNALGIEGLNVSFQDKFVFSEGSLQKVSIYLERKPPQKGDSGWYVGEMNHQGDKLGAAYVYQLLQFRPALMKVLALPVGYMVVFQNGKVQAILDSGNRSLDIKGLG